MNFNKGGVKYFAKIDRLSGFAFCPKCIKASQFHTISTIFVFFQSGEKRALGNGNTMNRVQRDQVRFFGSCELRV